MNFSIALLLVIGVAFVVAQSPSSQDDCKENSTFDACPPRNCPPGQFCTQQCIPACVCNDGYALNKQGVCEKVFTSPGNDDDVCGPKQVHMACPTNCPLECGKEPVPQGECDLRCKRSGCQCWSGLWKKGDDCVPKEEC